MRSIFLSVLFVLVLIATLIVSAPLSYVLDKSGLRGIGLNWASAHGSVFKGEVTGLRFGPQPIGIVKLDAQFGALLKGRLKYRFELQGVAGVGVGAVTLGRNQFELSGLDAEISVSNLVGIANEVRAANGIATVQGGTLKLKNGLCETAAGEISTDLLSKFATEQYNRTAGELSGDVSCDGEMVLLQMSGALEATDTVSLHVRAGLAEVSSVQVQVQTDDPVLEAGLATYGFQAQADGYVYQQDASFIRGVR